MSYSQCKAVQDMIQCGHQDQAIQCVRWAGHPGEHTDSLVRDVWSHRWFDNDQVTRIDTPHGNDHA